MTCKICGQDAHGTHFGAPSCRACAAFFRRYATSKYVTSKCQRKPANLESCVCRPCRLRKCFEIGMNTEKFQFNRDKLFSLQKPSTCALTPSIQTFVGRPEFLLFCDPIQSSFSNLKVFIDVQHLISEASHRLNQGCETPIYAENQLKKLALGSKFLKVDMENVKIFEKIGKSEFLDVVEFYFMTVAKWIVHFDEFQILDNNIKMTLLHSIWHIWLKMHKCAASAAFRKSSGDARPRQKILRNMRIEGDVMRMDTSWISDYPNENVALYMNSQNLYDYDIMEAFEKLNPTDVELTYMFAQVSFEYAGKRFPGDIQKVTDHFQQVLSNDLHNYYVNEQRNPRYFRRLADLMKVNNLIQKSIWESRPHRELNKVFNVLKIGYSHPEMFEDSAFY